MSEEARAAGGELRTYAIGCGLALALTGLSFAAVLWRPFSDGATLGTVFGLGLVQAVVHFRYFLHIGLQKSHRDDLQLILFSALIIALMAGGTVVILLNLRHRMM
jgi:cytochrome o ubiquinol oxidase subunit IV